MIVGCLRQSIKNRGRVRVPSSPIDVLARHLEHVSLTDLSTDPLDLPTLAEVLDTVPDPRSRLRVPNIHPCRLEAWWTIHPFGRAPRAPRQVTAG
jgi:hypothetical protein